MNKESKESKNTDKLNNNDEHKSDKKNRLKLTLPPRENLFAKEFYRGNDGNTYCLTTRGGGEIVSDVLWSEDKEDWDEFMKCDAKNKDDKIPEELDEKLKK